MMFEKRSKRKSRRKSRRQSSSCKRENWKGPCRGRKGRFKRC